MKEKKDKEWHAITVALPKEGSDWISHLLIELGSVGNLEEEYPDPALMAMKGYFPTECGSSNAIMQQISELLKQKGIEPVSTFSTTIKIQNWAENAQQVFTPIKITDKITVINPWSDYKKRSDETTIVINPGMAFGTGLHATTQLAARLMIEVIGEHSPSPSWERTGLPATQARLRARRAGVRGSIQTMCDVGAGSGILSIIASKLGVDKIDAVEVDVDARSSATENIKRNSCDKNITLYDKIDKVQKTYNIVIANILCGTIIYLKDKLTKRINDDGFLILSGITKEEDEKLTKEFSNLHLVKKTEQDDWMGYLYAPVHN